jgi:hypothetical protein
MSDPIGEDLFLIKSSPIGSLIKNYLIPEMASFSVDQSIATIKSARYFFVYRYVYEGQCAKFLHGLMKLRHEEYIRKENKSECGTY